MTSSNYSVSVNLRKYCCFLLVGLAWMSCALSLHAAELISIRHNVITGQHSRVDIEFDHPVSYQFVRLANPPRLVIDFANTKTSISASYLQSMQSEYLASIRRSGLFSNDLRLVFDLRNDVNLMHVEMQHPSVNRWGLSVALGRGKPLSISAITPAAKAWQIPNIPHSSPTLPNAKDAGLGASPSVKPNVPMAVKTPIPKIIVVLDAGHGGEDPGATGLVFNTLEKKVTLRFAKMVKKQLEQTGRYKAMLTREDDTYISLQERLNIARKAGAHLFISLHADSHPDPTMQGLSVYTLSEQGSDKEALSLVAQENKADIIRGVDLNHQSSDIAGLLIDLTQRQTKNISAQFAELIVQEFAKEAELLRKAHRFAGFKVLKGVDIPAVLIELGYLSNPEEESKLRKDWYLQKLVQALHRAIDRQFHIRTAVIKKKQ